MKKLASVLIAMGSFLIGGCFRHKPVTASTPTTTSSSTPPASQPPPVSAPTSPSQTAPDGTHSPVIRPTAVKAVMTFNTLGKPQKDWNSQIKDYVQCQGSTILRLECCSASRPENGVDSTDEWKAGWSRSRPMVIVSPFKKGDLKGQGCDMSYGFQPVGNNDWETTSRLDITYDDGTVEEWTFPDATLTKNEKVNVFHLDQNYPSN